jgi:hypothetical protein
MKKYLLLIFVAVFSSSYAQLKSPSQFIDDYGKNISYYHQVEEYFDYLKENSNSIIRENYGVSNQKNNLNVYYISSENNLNNLNQIRLRNLSKIGLHKADVSNSEDKVFVWLSFNVHGNEWSATESAMQVAYELLNPENKESKKYLENIIVILDPCLNPDGYSRYGSWLRNNTGKLVNSNKYDLEHNEEWPGGRYNHYLFDLNRDWAWQTQVETKSRIRLYNKWMPHVHADVHEQGYNSPYFFPPAAQPQHQFVDKFQKEFHKKLADNLSVEFDENNWLYFTGERFDLFYPSYGDTYPIYNGAVGMTLEQGGIRAGRSIMMENGVELTIQDRIDHHKTAVLGVVKTAYEQQEMLLKGHKNYFSNQNKQLIGQYSTFVVKNSPKLRQLTELLDANNILYSYSNQSLKTKGFNYFTKKDQSFVIDKSDLIVEVNQAKGALTQILFNPSHKLSDSLSYDITAWSLPLAYGIQSYALKSKLKIDKSSSKLKADEVKLVPEKVFAFYIPWNNRESAKILSKLHINKIKVRSALKDVVFKDVKVEKGGLIVSKADNPKIENFEKSIAEIIKSKEDYKIIKTGYSRSSQDLGGRNFNLLKAPKVLILTGEETRSTSYGATWHYFDEIIKYPHTVVKSRDLNFINLNEFNTLMMVDGRYSFDKQIKLKLNDWIRAGGKVIAVQGALRVFENDKNYSLVKYANDKEKKDAIQKSEQDVLKERYFKVDSDRRRSVSKSISGAIIENSLDDSHPLSFALGDKYFSLKTSSNTYSLLKGADNVIYIPNNYISYGFVGYKLKDKLKDKVSFAVEKKSRGSVIYMFDDPLFRGFWENGIQLFSNALFLVE